MRLRLTVRLNSRTLQTLLFAGNSHQVSPTSPVYSELWWGGLFGRNDMLYICACNLEFLAGILARNRAGEGPQHRTRAATAVFAGELVEYPVVE